MRRNNPTNLGIPPAIRQRMLANPDVFDFSPTYISTHPFSVHYPITISIFRDENELMKLLAPFSYYYTFFNITNPYELLLKMILHAFQQTPYQVQLTNRALDPIKDSKAFKLEVASMIEALYIFEVIYKSNFKGKAEVSVQAVSTAFGYQIGSQTIHRIIFSFMYLIIFFLASGMGYRSVLNNLQLVVEIMDPQNQISSVRIIINLNSSIDTIFKIIYNALDTLFQNGMERYRSIGNRPINIIAFTVQIHGITEINNMNTFKTVLGNNTLWMNIFTGAYGAKYDDFKIYMVVIPEVANSNCFLRALNCDCDSGTICTCIAPIRRVSEFYSIERIRHDFVNSDILFIEICIGTKKESYRKSCEVIVKGNNFFNSNQARVIFINTTTYAHGEPHCCIMKIPITLNEDEPLKDKFKRYDVYNKLISLICHDEKRICPCCGVAYYRKEQNTHWMSHDDKGEFKCERCGLQFDIDDELKIHQEYHCRIRTHPYNLCFADCVKGYVEKGDVTETIIYADLESAINEDGIHTNILCGWVCTDDLIVHTSDRLEDFIRCILRIKSSKILVYFHNGENYDFHFLIDYLLDRYPDFHQKISLMCDSSEKIKSFSLFPNGAMKKEIMFKDTFAFVSESLENWVKSTKDTKNCDFRCVMQQFPEDLSREFLFKKNPFPYKAIKDASYLSLDIKQLQNWMLAENNVELFCNRFTNEELHDMANNWYYQLLHHYPDIETVKDYYIKYLICDVAQLCDCMEYFNKSVYEEYGIYAHKYLGIPSLSWAAWLKNNKIQLDPIPMKAYDVITSSIRGGQCGAMTRYYDMNKDETKSLCCDLDCNALYATVMLKFAFPCHGWREISTEYYQFSYEFSYDDGFSFVGYDFLTFLKELHYNGESGFIEVDMDVLSSADVWSYMPVASRRRLKGIYNDSPYLQKSAELNELNLDEFEFNGLVNVSGVHNHYCCHTRLLEFYLEHSFVRLNKIHQFWVATDEYIFKDYVQNNLDQRKKFADDPIKKSLYKLMNNSLYGKTYEDITKRRNIKIMHKDRFKKLPFYTVSKILYEIGDYVIYDEPETIYTIDKPIYLGAAITEYSKLWMYKFFYEEVRPKFPMAEVFYTDTDALTIHFGDPMVTSFMDIARIMNTEEKQIIDTSNWSNLKDLPLSWTQHNNEPGLFKSETGDHKIVKMVALRAKSYMMICDNGEIKCSLKGCPKNEKDKVTFNDFEDILFNRKPSKIVEYEAILSKHHIVSSTMVSKLILSNDDRKRKILDDGISTLPFKIY